MRRFPPPRSGVRRASPAPSLGRKKQPREAHSAESGLGPGRLQRTARRVARQHRGARQCHPCPCGERVADSMVTLLAYGSPPPMRGMPARTAFFCSSIGSPPHTRGTVLFCVIPVGMPPHGSPPPVRGKGGRVMFTLSLSGITPAHAGKSCPQRTLSPRPQDHPRACGKKWKIKCANTRRKGSPPRMRGKALRLHGRGRLAGITPACAGKRGHLLGGNRQRRDHPRVCGEKSSAVCSGVSSIGSPPHVRGKGRLSIVIFKFCRITPACAGKRA